MLAASESTGAHGLSRYWKLASPPRSSREIAYVSRTVAVELPPTMISTRTSLAGNRAGCASAGNGRSARSTPSAMPAPRHLNRPRLSAPASVTGSVLRGRRAVTNHEAVIARMNAGHVRARQHHHVLLERRHQRLDGLERVWIHDLCQITCSLEPRPRRQSLARHTESTVARSHDFDFPQQRLARPMLDLALDRAYMAENV